MFSIIQKDFHLKYVTILKLYKNDFFIAFDH